MLDYNISILSHKRKGAKGEYQSIFLRLAYAGGRKDISLGISVPKGCFNTQSGTITKCENAKELNMQINTHIQGIKDVFVHYEYVEHIVPTITQVIDKYNSARGKKRLESNLFHDIVKRYIRENAVKNSWGDSTKVIYKSLASNIEKFDKDLLIEYVTVDKLNEFLKWHIKKRLKNSSIKAYFIVCNRVLAWASERGLYNGDAHKKFQFRLRTTKEKDIIYLTEEELNKLKTFKGRYIDEVVRDAFLFSCFSGLRLSDVSQLRFSHINNGCINFTTKKTDDPLHININKHTQEILDRRKEYSHNDNDLVFEQLPPYNGIVNNILRSVCGAAQINDIVEINTYTGAERKQVSLPKYQVITFHCGRRTFITHALRLGMPVPVIMKFSGHHSIEMLKPYMKVVDELKEKEMKKFDEM